MGCTSFTGADKAVRNLGLTAAVSVPVLLVAVLVPIRGMSGGWSVLGAVVLVWLLIAWRFAGVGRKGLPEQK